jgi:endoglucanase
MEKKAKEFLMKLLKTPSHSGDEVLFQKEWLKYVKKFADVETDLSGNAIGILNPKAKFKVFISGHCDEIGMLVTHVDDKGFVYFTKSGGVDPMLLSGLKVEIYGEKKTIPGVIGFPYAVSGKWPEKVKCENLFIDCGYDNGKELRKHIKCGDYILYKSEPEVLGDDKLVCKGMDDKTGAFIVAEVLRKLSKKKVKVGVYGVSTTGEETNLRGAYYAASRIKPNMGIACDVTYNSDSPGEDEKQRGAVHLGKGPVLSSGSPINKKINKLIEKAAKKLKLGLQYELTPMNTYTDADKIQFSGDGVPVALCSLPLRYMHSPIEVASMKDIENEINILVEMIAGLTGKEDLRPVIA